MLLLVVFARHLGFNYLLFDFLLCFLFDFFALATLDNIEFILLDKLPLPLLFYFRQGTLIGNLLGRDLRDFAVAFEFLFE